MRAHARPPTKTMALALALAAASVVAQEEAAGPPVERAGWAALFAVPILPAPPAWADLEEPPLFVFAWLSDMHLDARRFDEVRRALQFVRTQIQPLFVVLTGDNSAHTPPEDPHRPEPEPVRRHRFFRAFLEEHLALPFAVIPGDNWPFGFEEVFGPAQRAFSVGGLRFMLLALDAADHRTEGLSVFDEPTWRWMTQDLERHGDRPTLVLLHEPIVPPTFLDAGRLRELLDRHPNVLAGLHGHLHQDMQWLDRVRPYLVCPALGPGSPPGFKTVKVHRQALIVETYAVDAETGRWTHASKWQRIDVPPALGAGLFAPVGPFAPVDEDAVPAHPHRDRPELAARQPELGRLIGRFLAREVLQSLRNRPGPG